MYRQASGAYAKLYDSASTSVDNRMKRSELTDDFVNENQMSDDGRERAPLGVEVWTSSQKWSVRRSVVRSIAWLDDMCCQFT